MKRDELLRRTDGLTSILGADASFDGNLTLEGSLRIEGAFQGSVSSGGSVTIGERGRFNGDLSAEEVILGGEIVGSVVARKLVVLEGSSRFEGELTCGCLHVNEGALFNGTSSMGERAVEAKLGAVRAASRASGGESGDEATFSHENGQGFRLLPRDVKSETG